MTGLVLVELKESISEERAIDEIMEAMEATPPGRYLCISYVLPTAWCHGQIWESVATRLILGSPTERSSGAEWQFAGNVFIRVCRKKSAGRDLEREMALVIFRRAGAPAYSRRSEIGPSDLRLATLPVLHPVFTRDVANNVWHIPSQGFKTRIRRRLQALYTWPDEATILIGSGEPRRLPWRSMNLDDDLVGVPSKKPYDWHGQGSLFPLA